MTQDELMIKAAEKVVAEESPESIEFLFRPITAFELFLRLDLEGMKKKVREWISDDDPWAMPHRHRYEPYAIMRRAIQVEEFYQTVQDAKTIQDARI